MLEGIERREGTRGKGEEVYRKTLMKGSRNVDARTVSQTVRNYFVSN